MEPPDREQDESEKTAVIQHRFDEAKAAGLTDLQAAEFSIADTDVGLLRKLVNGHCPPQLLGKIVT